nr:glycosyltransferase family 2 protein [uncultured Flavobacterium sp.]
MESNLAIAIPTYNRAEIIKFNLESILEELKKFNIPVYISDDSTDDSTELLIKQFKSKHDLFYYRRNEVRFGHDLNCINTITFPKEKYVWYLGDSMIIEPGSIEHVLKCIENENFDFICCNADGRDLNITSRIFTDKTEIFENLCWHLTLTGATIYNKEKLAWLHNFDISKFKNFPQTAIIFEQLVIESSNLYWINKSLVRNNPNKTSYWARNVFNVFLEDFSSFVLNLPEDYPLSLKIKVIRYHSQKTGIFSYFSFVNYRIEGYYDYTTFLKYRTKFKKFTINNIYILLIIALFPRVILKYISNICTEKP